MHHMCCGAPSGLKVILYFRPTAQVTDFHENVERSVPRQAKGITTFICLPKHQSLNFAKSFRVPIPRLHCVLTSPLSCTLFLCGTTTEWLVKSRKINITPYQWLTNELSISWEQLWKQPRLTKIRQPSNTPLITSNYVLSSFDTYTSIPCPILMHHMCCGAHGNLKVILYFRPTAGWPTFMKTLSGVFLGRLKVLLPLSVCRSTNRLISLSLFGFQSRGYIVYWPVPYHVPCSCVEQLQSGSSSLARLT